MIDVLNRDEMLNSMIKMIELATNNKKKLSLAIDGAWGSGKSWVVEQLDEILSKIEIDGKPKYMVVNYNCWENDYYVEPLQGILNEISRIRSKDIFEPKIMNALVSLGQIVVLIGFLLAGNPKFGVATAGGLEAIKNNCKDDVNLNISEQIDNAVDILNTITTDTTLVFIVDEIDRTLPDYAIKVLERIHHIFNRVDNCITIVSTDKTQLDKTVSKIFGFEDSNIIKLYFKKFFDITFKLDYGNLNINNLEILYKELFEKSAPKNKQIPTKNIIVKDILSSFNIRDKLKILDQTNLIFKALSNNDENDHNYVIFLTTLIYVALKEENYNNKLSLHSSPVINYFEDLVRRFVEPFGDDIEFRLNSTVEALASYVYLILTKPKRNDLIFNAGFYDWAYETIRNIKELFKYVDM